MYEGGKGLKIEFNQPATWDYLWATQQAAELLKNLEAHRVATPVWHARAAQCLLTLDVRKGLYFLEEGIRIYEGKVGMDVDLLRSIRLLALLELEECQQIITEALPIAGTSAVRLEAACHQHYALSCAYKLLGDLPLAMRHLGSAQALAQALSLEHRLQVLTIHAAQIANAMGTTVDWVALRGAANSTHRSTARWGRGEMIQTLMFGGQYRRALELAIQYEQPEYVLILQGFLGALDGEKLSEVVHDELAAQLTQALQQLTLHNYQNMPIIHCHHGNSMYSYAGILNAIRAHYLAMPALFESSLGPEPARSDQKIYWLALRIFGALQNYIADNPAQLAQRLMTTLDTLPYSNEILEVLGRLFPPIAALLCYFPHVRLQELMSRNLVPVLVDTYIIGLPQKVSVSRTYAEAVIAEALQQKIVINSGESSRTRKRLKQQGLDAQHLVNIGQVYKYIITICEAAGSQERERWRNVLTGVRQHSSLITELVQEFGIEVVDHS